MTGGSLSPTEPAASGRWSAPPARRCFPRAQTVGAVVLLFLVLSVGVPTLLGRPEYVFFSIFVWASSTALALRRLPDRRRIIREDRAILEDAGDPEAFLVEIHVVRDGAETGHDRGVLFMDGVALCFVGHATSFRIGCQDVVLEGTWNEYTLRFGAPSSWLKLPLRHPDKQIWIGFEILPTRAHPKRLGFGHLAGFLQDFAKQSVPADGPRQYPPLIPPESVAQAFP